MNRISVISSNLNSVGYDSSTQTLEVEFNDGSIYHYFDVPSSEHSGLMNASSKGSYLSSNIKGRYRYQRVN